MFLLLLLAALVQPSLSSNECRFSIEALVLQDGSYSFETEIGKMANFMGELMDSLHEDHTSVKLGCSSFVDKPIPISGYGAYGNNVLGHDYCYRQHSPLSPETTDIIDGLHHLYSNLGDGNDFPENPLEGLLFAALDDTVGWSSPDQLYDPATGTPYLRVVIIVTDDLYHVPGDAREHIENFWEYERWWDEEEKYSFGGFGAHNFPSFGQIWLGDDEVEYPQYEELADLYYIVDHQGEDALSDVQRERFQTLNAHFGPAKWPKLVDHPGDNSQECHLTEYPTPEQVGEVLRAKKIFPIFLTSGVSPNSDVHDLCANMAIDNIADCLAEVYADLARQMNVMAVTAPIDSDSTLSQIKNTLAQLSDNYCSILPPQPTFQPESSSQPEITTTESTSTEQVVTTHLTTTESTTTEQVVESTSTEQVVTTHLATSEPTTTEQESTTQVSTSQLVTSEPDVSTNEHSTTAIQVVTSESETIKVIEQSSTEVADLATTTLGLSSTKDQNQSPAEILSTEDVTTTFASETYDRSEDVTLKPATSESTQTSNQLLTTSSVTTRPGGGQGGDQQETTEETTTFGEESTDDSEYIGIGGGPGIGVIAGASVGAIGGVAALAGAVYGVGGAVGAFGGAPAEALDAIQQVEVPESPIEREIMEEVTTDMFQ